MKKSLEEKIKERKQQALNKNIGIRASTITERLGFGTSWDDPRDSTYKRFRFHNDKFLIKCYFYYLPEFSSPDSKKDIFYLGKLVFQSRRNEITSYVPGDWEKEFNELYLEAVDIKKEPLKPKTEEEKLKEKWGLE